MKKRNANAVVYLIFFLTLFLAFCAFAIDATIVFTTRAKLQGATEEAALVAASDFNSSTTVTESDIEAMALGTFNLLKVADLKPATITVDVKLGGKKVLVTTQTLSPTFFLSFLGVSSIKLQAEALAISEKLPVTAKYNSINWITAAASYQTDIISKWPDTTHDTEIRNSINYPSASIDQTSGIPIYKLLDSASIGPLSLGPGGSVTIKLPAPIIDKPGPDLSVVEAGAAAEGYLVFAGLDVDPTQPYVDYTKTGAGIHWKNITCSGVPLNQISSGKLGAYSLGSDIKFYGSANFDLGAPCVGLSMAKYIRIIDDNDESAFVGDSAVMLYGESSTPTAGADIDSVTVLNHVRLLPPSQF